MACECHVLPDVPLKIVGGEIPSAVILTIAAASLQSHAHAPAACEDICYCLDLGFTQ